MAKPDDRSNNASRIRNSIENTEQNLQEAQSYLDEHAEEISPQELSAIQSKNKGRQAAIEGFQSELQDEEPLES
ncbi:small acid-soluble spore protein Tlp [Paenibacillus kobensis]|uniref:small acid-soluble spore protein Tlp n=1 Tax=Paenibacillus kobensis TaxID=59841 RepID=UPI000FDA5C7B|nr:small acid-soluble spore protein Tlp [Paenibacillus kobensis]